MSKHAEKVERTPILITMGEPAGVGPEVAAKAWRILGGRAGARALMFAGNPKVFRQQGAFPDHAFWNLAPAPQHSSPAVQVIAAIGSAVEAVLSKKAAAVVTAPIHKAMLLDAGF